MILETAAVIGMVTVIVIAACFKATGIYLKANGVDTKDNIKSR